eukprot:3512072-Pyramimonas_sp.AAC.1
MSIPRAARRLNFLAACLICSGVFGGSTRSSVLLLLRLLLNLTGMLLDRVWEAPSSLRGGPNR